MYLEINIRMYVPTFIQIYVVRKKIVSYDIYETLNILCYHSKLEHNSQFLYSRNVMQQRSIWI